MAFVIFNASLSTPIIAINDNWLNKYEHPIIAMILSSSLYG